MWGGCSLGVGLEDKSAIISENVGVDKIRSRCEFGWKFWCTGEYKTVCRRGVLFAQALGFVDTGRQVAYQFKVGRMLLGLGWFGVCLVIRESSTKRKSNNIRVLVGGKLAHWFDCDSQGMVEKKTSPRRFKKNRRQPDPPPNHPSGHEIACQPKQGHGLRPSPTTTRVGPGAL